MDFEEVETFLAHYASKYYDPVKAREYYLRTRELKGKEPALSKESRARQQEANLYVSDQIRTRREADLAKNAKVREGLNREANDKAAEYAAKIQKLQGKAEATRRDVAEKLASFIDRIKNELKIPPNASPKVRAFLENQRAKRLNTAVNKAKSEIGKIQVEFKDSLSLARDDYQKFRASNAEGRRSNAEERRKISDTYRQDLANERQYIKDNVR